MKVVVRQHRTVRTSNPSVEPTNVNAFHASIASRRAKEAQELAEEARLRRAMEKERARREQDEDAQRRRLAAKNFLEDRSARHIQRTYREWAATHLTSRHSKAGKSEVERIRSVARYAQTWLKKTAGGRFVARLRGRKHPQEWLRIVRAVSQIQRCWRHHAARGGVQRKRAARKQWFAAVRENEAKIFAAFQIQLWFRSLRARRKVTDVRTTYQRQYCVLIQRWVRKVQHKSRKIEEVKRALTRRSQAATKIQAAWRGYQGRLTAVVLRLKRKINKMRAREKKAAESIQRVGRGYIGRHCQSRSLVQKVKEATRNRATRPTVVCNVDALREGIERKRDDEHRAWMSSLESELNKAQEDSRTTYLEVCVEQQRQQICAAHTHQIKLRDVELARGGESLLRSQELKLLMRVRAAKLIQRVWRRWWVSATPSERTRFEYHRARLQGEHFEKKRRAAEELARRTKLRQENDLGKDARTLKEEALHELASTAPVAEYAQSIREEDDRVALSRRVKRLEDARATQQHLESVPLRTIRVGGTTSFKTVKQQRSKIANAREPHAGSPEAVGSDHLRTEQNSHVTASSHADNSPQPREPS